MHVHGFISSEEERTTRHLQRKAATVEMEECVDVGMRNGKRRRRLNLQWTLIVSRRRISGE